MRNEKKQIEKSSSIHTKSSFQPISNSETKVLVLGTLPGDKSLELGEYYGHPRNRFWKIIAAITNNELPLTYPDKKLILLKSKIGVWDVAHQANRKGSLDSAIEAEVPNNLNEFLNQHPNIKIVGFNGTKSQVLFDKYFERRMGIQYIRLPSSSPANARIDFAGICKLWQQLLIA